MNRSTAHPLSTTLRLIITAMLVLPLALGMVGPARAFASPATVDLGAAGSFAILTKTGITNVPTSAITGDLGASPIDSTAITGFALTLYPTGTFSTSPQVTGKIYAADYADPTPANLTTAVLNMEAAYTDAAGRANPDATELYAGILDGQSLAPGLYKWGTGVSLGIATAGTDVTLSGSATDVWIFQIAGDLTIGSGSEVLMSGGALPANVFWQVGGGTGVEIGTYAHVEGTILAAKAIHLRTGATLDGRALSQTAVTLDGNTVVSPAGGTMPPEPYIVVPADYTGDVKTDPAKFEPGTGMVWWRNSATLLWEGADLGMDVAMYVERSDFDGDGTADPAKFVSASNAVWWIKSSTGLWDGVYMGPGTFEVLAGSDFDGDGETDPSRFDTTSNALWYLESSTSTWKGVYMGPGTFEVVTGSDYDGDLKTDPARFDTTSNALWYLESTTSTWQGVYMGPGTYEMVEASDLDGDGETDPALFYPTGGANALWYLPSSTGTWVSVYMGPGTLEPVAAGDFDGDGETDPAEFVPATEGLWWLKSSTGLWEGVWMGVTN